VTVVELHQSTRVIEFADGDRVEFFTGTRVSGSFEGVHNDIGGRDADDAHPISAVTGLQDALDNVGGGAVDSVDGRTGVVTLGDLYDAAGAAAGVAATLADVATSGDYDDLSNTPTIPDVSGLVETTDPRLVDATGATAGHVWTADGADGAEFAAPSGGGGVYELIVDTILSTDAAQVDFTIPSHIRFIRVEYAAWNTATTAGNTGLRMQFNDDTATNYASAGVDDTTFITIGGVSSSLATIRPSFGRFEIWDVADTHTVAWGREVRSISTGVAQNNSVDRRGIWKNTAKVTKVSVVAQAGDVNAGSRFIVTGR
jgi:hypothetical protein